MPTSRSPRKLLTIDVTTGQLELLKRYDFPGSQDVIASARRTGGRFRLEGSRTDMESLIEGVLASS